MKLNIQNRIPRSVKYGSLGILSTVVLLTSCGDKDKTTDVPEPPKREIVTATPGQRAQTLGLLAHVPADMQAVIAVYDLPYIVSSVENSNIGRFLASKGVTPSLDPDDAIEVVDVDVKVDGAATANSQVTEGSVDVSVSASCPVTNVVIACGSSQIEFLKALGKDYGMINNIIGGQYANLIGSAMMGMTGDQAQEQLQQEILKQLPNMELFKLIDFAPGSGAAPLMVISEMTPELITQAQANISQGMGMGMMLSQGAIASYNKKVGDYDFNGIAIDGAKVADMLKKQQSPPGVDPQAIADLSDRMAKGKLYVLFAYKGNVMISAICTNPDKQLAMPATPADSILGQKGASFADQYLKSKPSFAIYTTPAYTQATGELLIDIYEADRAQMGSMLKGITNQEDIKGKEWMNKMVDEMNVVYDQYIANVKDWDLTVGITGYGWYDKGLNMEFVFGNTKAIDWSNPVTYSAASETPDAVFTYSATYSKDYMDRTTAMFEALGQFVWYAAEFVDANMDEADKNDEDYVKYSELARKLKPNVVKLWNTLKDADTAFGRQGVMVVDMKGKFPDVKNADIPKDVIANGCIPRIAFAEQLADRSKLAPAWKTIRELINDSVAKAGSDWKLGDPVSEEKDGYSIYYYNCPELPGYDMPAVTLNDKLFVMGTSKTFNSEVAPLCKPAASVTPTVYGPLGAYMTIHFAPMAKAAGEWNKIPSMQPKISKVKGFFDALSADLKSINATVSLEDNKLYSRIKLVTQ